MSSRQLRKLQQQRELEQAKLQPQAEAEAEESEEEAVRPTRSKPSLFANLAALQDEDEDEEDEEAVAKDEVDGEQNLNSPESKPASLSKKAKKSKKKKKKAKSKPSEQPVEPDDGADDIDAALRELDLKKPSGTAESAAVKADPEYERICALLGVSTQHLKVANEMRNLFGRTAADNHDDAGGPVGRGGRRRQRGQDRRVDLETALKGHHAPGKGLPELTLRRNALIQGKDDWPKGTTGGLTMVMVDDQREKDGTVEFRYDHNQSYQALQQAFNGYVQMGDPENLIGLLVRNPYHISLLIQVSKVAKDQSDHSLSSDLLERALFTFGRAATSLFNTQLSAGKARLDFLRPENRELWLAGYQYLKSLVMKGTYRTALEWAKLLLSLDPEEDPYCMRLMIHHLALRAHEFNWLLDLFESALPKIWNLSDDDHGTAMSHFTPSLAFAALQLREAAQCRQLLAESMQKVPWLFCRLFKDLDLAAPPSIWGVEPRTDAECLLTEIYVLQTKDLWNTPEATSLLMEVAHTISKPDVDSIPAVRNSEMTLDVVRFVYLDNTPALMSLAPSDLLHRENNSDADPLPPDHNIFTYESQRRVLERHDDVQGLGGDMFDPIAALARLLPGLRPRDGEQGEDDDSEDDNEMLRREFEEAVTANEEETGHDRGAPIPVSLARRLLDMIWPAPQHTDSDDDGHGTDDDDDDDDDDDIPDLGLRLHSPPLQIPTRPPPPTYNHKQPHHPCALAKHHPSSRDFIPPRRTNTTSPKNKAIPGKKQVKMAEVAEHKYKFDIAMSCGGCSGAVNRVLGKLEGVKSYDVSLDTQSATIVTEPSLSYEKVLQTIQKTGKKVTGGEADGEKKGVELVKDE
ncbi:Uncharacterized protein BP5553_05430 [Venustampulla echinocandica]|uniref:HMA domain-containing protein n=1 Tax=Venustampulla echinocandica TaxID=2656787 RepID=A0A370TR51_9HELO|nr:Uncharacterized protein BP5553_05430 [Venustampulla echinocandica]RDL37997.1 Uncharacterized protein BP5553_05430 [Venustampulla echinocandica]